MTWSHVATASGSTSSASFSPTWPAGVQAGDVVVLCAMITTDTGGQFLGVTSAPGWRTTSQVGAEARFMACIYSPAQPLPVLSTTNSPTTYWRMVAFRSTVGASWGRDWHADGYPPAATSLTTLTPNTLLVVFGSAVGDQPAGWSFQGTGGSWNVITTQSGSGSGDPAYPNIGIAWQQVATPASLTGLRALLVANRYFLLEVGEPQWAGGFFE